MPRQPTDFPDPIEYLSILSPDGIVDRALEPQIPAEDLRKLYRTMLLARRADERLLILQRQGRIGTVIPNRGQEAAALGSAYAVRPTDWMVPYFRELAAYLWRGWSLGRLVLYLAGHAEGMAIPEGVRDLPLCIPVGSQLPHAVGLAYAARYRKEESVVLAYLGDGATSQGDFHEAMNFAGVFCLPVIFCCVNNQWAISMPVTKQTRAPTLARKALAYGVPGLQVDGNDLLAVAAATREAVTRARAGDGPTLIECLTYRLGPHSSSDDPRKYRSDEETTHWVSKDPVTRFRRYLEGKGVLDEDGHRVVDMEVEAEIQLAVQASLFQIEQDVSLIDVFSHVYADLPQELSVQREQLICHLADKRPTATKAPRVISNDAGRAGCAT